MTEQTAKQQRPFHETIVDAILEASAPGEVALLAKMIKETKIPKGHDEIIVAWRHRQDDWGLGFGHGVVENPLEQKREAERKEEEKKAKEQTAATATS